MLLTPDLKTMFTWDTSERRRSIRLRKKKQSRRSSLWNNIAYFSVSWSEKEIEQTSSLSVNFLKQSHQYNRISPPKKWRTTKNCWKIDLIFPSLTPTTLSSLLMNFQTQILVWIYILTQFCDALTNAPTSFLFEKSCRGLELGCKCLIRTKETKCCCLGKIEQVTESLNVL